MFFPKQDIIDQANYIIVEEINRTILENPNEMISLGNATLERLME